MVVGASTQNFTLMDEWGGQAFRGDGEAGGLPWEEAGRAAALPPLPGNLHHPRPNQPTHSEAHLILNWPHLRLLPSRPAGQAHTQVRWSAAVRQGQATPGGLAAAQLAPTLPPQQSVSTLPPACFRACPSTLTPHASPHCHDPTPPPLQVALAEAFAARWGAEGVGILSLSMHPGWAETEGVRTSIPGFYKSYKNKLRSTAQGCETTVWLALQVGGGWVGGGLGGGMGGVS